MKLRLAEIAHARSGDKADRADLGLFAWDAAGYAALARVITRERIAAHFAHHLGSADAGRVDLYPLPNLLAIKLVLNGALNGGAALSLRSDNLGKTLGAQLLRMEVELPTDEAALVMAGVKLALENF
nr:hypothetical protein [uncultured Roseateles sp.]